MKSHPWRFAAVVSDYSPGLQTPAGIPGPSAWQRLFGFQLLFPIAISPQLDEWAAETPIVMMAATNRAGVVPVIVASNSIPLRANPRQCGSIIGKKSK